MAALAERYRAPGTRTAELAALKERALIERHPKLGGLLARPRAEPPIPFDSGAVVLGRDSRDRPLVLPERARLEHMHVIGATGSGKTNLLEHLIRQDIVLGRGVLVIDPHGNHPGSLYRSLLAWIAGQGFDRTRTLHLIDPNATSHTFGFNPLSPPDAETAHSVVAEAVFEAFERLWGDEDGNSKPTIQRVLTATFTALSEQGMTLAEARLLLDPDDRHGIRARVLEQLEDSYAHDEIDWLHHIGLEKGGRRDFRAEVVGPLNRIAKLVRSPTMRTIVGQARSTIDLRQAMDEGHIILCNLAGGAQVYEQGADMLGRLLTRFVFFHARRRRRPERMFVAYLDECHRYLSGDIPNMLAEVRKHGVAIVAAHQWLAQLGRPDDPVREAVCKGPNIKVVFRIKDPREAAELAEAVMPLDLERPVAALIKPTVVGHRRTLFHSASAAHSRSQTVTTGESESVTESEAFGTDHSVTHSESTSETAGRSSTDSSGESASRSDPDEVTDSTGRSDTTSSSTTTVSSTAETDGTSHTMTRGETVGHSTSRGRTKGTTETRGYSEGIEPAYQNLPSAVHGKDAMLYAAAQELLSLTTGAARIAYVGADGRMATRVRVPKVRSVVADEHSFAAIRLRIFEQSGSAIPMATAQAAVADRERRLIVDASKATTIKEPAGYRVQRLKDRQPKPEKQP